MGDIYVARQPVFDRRMKLYGYELLYRRSANNFFEGEDDNQATAALFTDSFFMGYEELIDDTRGFINFSQKLLLDGIPLLLPKSKVVVEILERVEITDEVIAACKELKQQGYTLALDDFVFSDNYAPLMKFVDIIKVEFPSVPLKVQSFILNKYLPKITFLSEKVETVEEYHQASSMGYSLFQGYFFSKPIMVGAKEIGTLNDNLVFIAQKLSEPDPDFKAIAAIIERDVELSYKLLRIANSAYYGARLQIKSIHHALVQLGVQDLLRWGNLLLLKGLQNSDNAELVKTSLIRARMLSQFAVIIHGIERESDFFFAGLFSSIDALLHESMDKVLARLPLTDTVKEALLGNGSDLCSALNTVLCFEKANWDCTDAFLNEAGLSPDTFMSLYYEALRWEQSLDT